MVMIPSVIIGDDYVNIPVFGSLTHFARMVWTEEMTCEDALRVACNGEFPCKWGQFCVWEKDSNDSDHNGIFDVHVYDIFCSFTADPFHLIIYNDLEDFDDIKNSVCLPFNRLNLLMFFKEYLVPFSNKKIFHG